MEYFNQNHVSVLVADENNAQRTQLKDALMRAGFHHIEEAVNGDDALLKIKQNHPDIAIIDIWLSKLDGIGVIRESARLDYIPCCQSKYVHSSVGSRGTTLSHQAHSP